jgi:hypothetical protein
MAGGRRAARTATPSLNLIPVMQHVIHLRGFVEGRRIVAVLEVGLAARLDDRHVGVYDHVSRAGQLLDGVAGGVVVPVPVADEEDLDVGELEAEPLTLARMRGDVLLKTAVDKDVPSGVAAVPPRKTDSPRRRAERPPPLRAIETSFEA